MSGVSKNMYSYKLSEDDVSKLPTLHRFVWKGKFHKVLSVLSDNSKKNKVNKKDHYQRTPYHLAASRGDVKILQFLLSIDTKSIHCLDSDGRTAFYKACQVLSLECMQVLVSYGSRTVCTDFKKCTIMEKLVIEFGDGSSKHLEYLIANQPRECKYINECKVLDTAVKYGRIGVVKFLIQLGFDINVPEQGTGKTMLMKSIESGYYNVTEALLKGNADIHMKDHQGKSAHDYAQKLPRIGDLLKEYDRSIDDLGHTSKNKVFVTFHKTFAMESEKAVIDDRKNDLLKKIKEMENQIEQHKNDLKKSKKLNDELHEKLQADLEETALKKLSDEQKRKSKSSQHHELPHQRPKVLLKKLFKAGYQSKEEWAAEFDHAVEKYDELQRGFEKLLLAESEKELEIDECLESIEKAEIQKDEDQKKAEQLKNELKTIQDNIVKIENEKSVLRNEIVDMKNAISKEKSRFKNVIEQANKFKSQLLNTIDQLKLKKKQKMEELKVFLDEQNELLAEIEECDHVINGQKKKRNKIVNKIKLLKNKIIEESASDNQAQEK